MDKIDIEEAIMRRFKFTVGMTAKRMTEDNLMAYVIDLPKEVTDEDVEKEWQGCLNNYLENMGYHPDEPAHEPFGRWEEL